MPTPRVALGAGLAALAVGGAFAFWVARLRRQGVRVAYTRKIFHFGVFSAAAVVHALWGLPGTNVFGGVISLLVLAAVRQGEGGGLYEALAREGDRPHRSLFIIVPLVTTALGGLVSALVAGPHAVVGYLVAGWGDAVAEPVGSRWGRHRYTVPSLAGVRAERTLEGSAAVFLAGWLAAAAGLWSTGDASGALLVGLACAGVGTLVEALSPHGVDNFTIQVATSLTALWLVT